MMVKIQLFLNKKENKIVCYAKECYELKTKEEAIKLILNRYSGILLEDIKQRSKFLRDKKYIGGVK